MAENAVLAYLAQIINDLRQDNEDMAVEIAEMNHELNDMQHDYQNPPITQTLQFAVNYLQEHIDQLNQLNQ